jgi:cytoskeleton protein RodZ
VTISLSVDSSAVEIVDTPPVYPPEPETMLEISTQPLEAADQALFVPLSSTKPSVGSVLREAREGKGMTLAQLAGILKVQVQKLQALEAGDLGAFKDVVFLRALAASVCRVLKLDSAPVLASLPPSPVDLSVLRPAEDRSETPTRTPIIRQPLTEQISIHTVALVAFFLLGTLALLFFPREKTEEKELVAEPAFSSVTPPVSSGVVYPVASGLLGAFAVPGGSVPASVPTGWGSMLPGQASASGLPGRFDAVMPASASVWASASPSAFVSSSTDTTAKIVSAPRTTDTPKPTASSMTEISAVGKDKGRGGFVIGAAALASDRLTQSH